MATTVSDEVSTFFARLPGITPGSFSPRARLPGEDGPIQAAASEAPAPKPDALPVPTPWWVTRKTALLVASGMVLLIGSVGVLASLQHAGREAVPASSSPPPATQTARTMNPTGPARAVTAADGAALRPHVPQPSALATQAAPTPAARFHPTPEPAQAVAPHVTATAAPVSASPSTAAQDQLTQFEGFKPGAPRLVIPAPVAPTLVVTAPASGTPSASVAPLATSPAKVAAIVPSAAPSTPGVNTAGPTMPSVGATRATETAATALVPDGPARAPAVGPAPVEAAAHLVAQAVAIRAAPMAAQQQLAVLHLVTELGVLVRDQRKEIAALRGQVSDLSHNMRVGMTDFDRRLSIAEATGAISAAMGAGQKMAAPASAPAPSPAPQVPAAPQTAAAAPAPVVLTVSDYHIQAASPGLAMLSTADGGDSHITVGVGDDVPGIGRVKGVFQKGTSWVVETDHGVISR